VHGVRVKLQLARRRAHLEVASCVCQQRLA
jgi:hypothetical protein